MLGGSICGRVINPRWINVGLRIRRLASFATLEIEDIKTEFREVGDPRGTVSLTRNQGTGFAYVCIDYPEKKNALTGRMLVELHEALEDLSEWESGRGLILYGKGGTFSSGGDSETKKGWMSRRGGIRMSTFGKEIVRRIQSLPMVTACLISGKTFAASAELTLASDFRFMTPESKLVFNNSSLELGTVNSGGVNLIRLVGSEKALEILISGRGIGAEEAVRLGLARKVLSGGDDESSLSEVEEWMTSLMKGKTTEVIRMIKSVVAANDPQVEIDLFVKQWESISDKYGAEYFAQLIKK